MYQTESEGALCALCLCNWQQTALLWVSPHCSSFLNQSSSCIAHNCCLDSNHEAPVVAADNRPEELYSIAGVRPTAALAVCHPPCHTGCPHATTWSHIPSQEPTGHYLSFSSMSLPFCASQRSDTIICPDGHPRRHGSRLHLPAHQGRGSAENGVQEEVGCRVVCMC